MSAPRGRRLKRSTRFVVLFTMELLGLGEISRSSVNEKCGKHKGA